MHFAQDTTGACSKGVGVWGSARSPSFGFDARSCAVPNLHPLLKSQYYASFMFQLQAKDLFFTYTQQNAPAIRYSLGKNVWLGNWKPETESSAIDSTTDDRDDRSVMKLLCEHEDFTISKVVTWHSTSFGANGVLLVCSVELIERIIYKSIQTKKLNLWFRQVHDPVKKKKTLE